MSDATIYALNLFTIGMSCAGLLLLVVVAAYLGASAASGRRRRGAHVISDRMAPGYDPPSQSLDPPPDGADVDPPTSGEWPWQR